MMDHFVVSITKDNNLTLVYVMEAENEGAAVDLIPEEDFKGVVSIDVRRIHSKATLVATIMEP